MYYYSSLPTCHLLAAVISEFQINAKKSFGILVLGMGYILLDSQGKKGHIIKDNIFGPTLNDI